MRYTHAMEEAKRQQSKQSPFERSVNVARKNAGETPALPVSRHHRVTDENPLPIRSLQLVDRVGSGGRDRTADLGVMKAPFGFRIL